jgi:hypothetical protein
MTNITENTTERHLLHMADEFKTINGQKDARIRELKKLIDDRHAELRNVLDFILQATTIIEVIRKDNKKINTALSHTIEYLYRAKEEIHSIRTNMDYDDIMNNDFIDFLIEELEEE